MPRKTIIVGNGLGMAVNDISFSLDNAIGTVWDNEDLLSQAQKQLICNCLSDDHIGRPQDENQLDKLQMALSACEILQGIPDTGIHWLSDEGLLFPDAVRNFIHSTAKQFHLTDEELPNGFVRTLCEYLQETRSHIATLNYDNLLYRPMINFGILEGYNGQLVDGFHADGFNIQNLERRYGANFGYYLHLHGSPLFVDRGGSTIKLHQFELVENEDIISSHIVLTHYEHKPAVISSSKLLLSYWHLLSKAIGESEELILIGYSGLDAHLNSLIKTVPSMPIRIVEWVGAGEEEVRHAFWRRKLGRDIELHQFENILDFSDWE